MNRSAALPTLDIIIVNWNAGQLLRDCVESIEKTKQNNFVLERIVVVDNASTDGSLNYLEDRKVAVHSIRNESNLGFGAACNQGAKDSQSDYLLFLNPDTRLFDNSLNRPMTSWSS